ncbi:kinase-like domain-containing protein [Abortiporus biennis]|nr:kinase-like domain-containing protein [Abortiporus biennis]
MNKISRCREVEMLMPIHTAWITNETAYFVMPATKYSLSDYFDHIRLSQDDLTLDDKVIIAAELIEALSQLQKLKIIHGNIKPSNIRFAYDNHLVLTDFGSAHEYQEEADSMVDMLSCSMIILMLLEGREVSTLQLYDTNSVLQNRILADYGLAMLRKLAQRVSSGCLPFENPVVTPL